MPPRAMYRESILVDVIFSSGLQQFGDVLLIHEDRWLFLGRVRLLIS